MLVTAVCVLGAVAYGYTSYVNEILAVFDSPEWQP
jgi:hypothetical protein